MDNVIKLVIAFAGGSLALAAICEIINQFTNFFNLFNFMF